MNSGDRAVRSQHGLLTTLAASDRHLALEGSVFIAGAAIQWLRDSLKIIRAAADVEALAASVPDSGGVTFIPAFTAHREHRRGHRARCGVPGGPDAGVETPRSDRSALREQWREAISSLEPTKRSSVISS